MCDSTQSEVSRAVTIFTAGEKDVAGVFVPRGDWHPPLCLFAEVRESSTYFLE